MFIQSTKNFIFIEILNKKFEQEISALNQRKKKIDKIDKYIKLLINKYSTKFFFV